MNKARIILVSAMLISLSACAPSQDIDMLNSRVQQQDQALRQLNSQLSGVQPAQADTWSQVQSLRQELAVLRGDVDNLVRSLGNSGSRLPIGEQLARHQRALEQVESQLALELNIKETDLLDPNLANNPLLGGNTAMNQVPNQMGQTGQMGQVPNQTGQSLTPAPVAPVPPVAVPQVNKPVANTDTAQALYDAGMNSFNARKYQEGLTSFTDFTKTFAKHKLISNAWFWQGECYYQLGNFAAAAVSYEEVISKYPTSTKAPAAYLKQGMAFQKTGKNDAAKIRLDELIKKFPKSPEATRAAATLKDLK